MLLRHLNAVALRRVLALLGSLVAGVPAVADKPGASATAPHRHGAAQLLLERSNGSLEAELRVPAVDLLGFERRPASAEQRQRLQQGVAHLRAGVQLLGLPAAAACVQQTVRIDSPLLAFYDNRDRERPPPDRPYAAEHADLRARYHFVCAAPAALDDWRPAATHHVAERLQLEVHNVLRQGEGF